MASVVPTLNDVFLRAVEQAFGVSLMLVGPGLKTGMPILYEDPREVGADRIVNAVKNYICWRLNDYYVQPPSLRGPLQPMPARSPCSSREVSIVF